VRQLKGGSVVTFLGNQISLQQPYRLIRIAATKKVAHSEKSLYARNMMTPEQCRAARGWLGWTQQELARRARVGLSTVKLFEAGERKTIPATGEAMHRAIEAAGIGFLEEDGKAIGIRIRP
jgi:DNA-binding transcriptional regulator YiaG